MRLLYLIKPVLILCGIIILTTSCTHAQSSGVSKESLQQSASNKSAETYFHLGRSYQKHEKAKEAIDAYLRALKIMPSNDSLVRAICNHLAACYIDEDSILRHAFNNEMNAVQENHAIEIHKQALMARHQRNTATTIICSLIGITTILFISMYVNNRNKKKHIDLQQQLMRNQADKMQLKNELRQLKHTHQYIEKENREMQEKLFELWKQTIQICGLLFQTTASYKKLMIMDTTKVKRDRMKTHEEIAFIHEEVNKMFANALQELSEMSSGLTSDDLLFCVLNYLNLSTSTIKICMRVESSQALAQRKYRIKKHLDASVFTFVFGSSIVKEINN